MLIFIRIENKNSKIYYNVPFISFFSKKKNCILFNDKCINLVLVLKNVNKLYSNVKVKDYAL